ncbi:hypothetical protein BO78DRAFT_422005 [Aspergillus sclerotiicarbonarius CBS 121057]|uniref:Uncharacterized protein n=1 Tax=Aspergillus sclerotiicarbonarius (strain CBS 121057 / IBT 28362) TaxID=1448318 RepID=A0A319E0G7_ASPSB|nr:hypothetical protein BO78DRAFT_422005 [Aspergillus sclerotiicarbonarius CBS 121057]
MPTLDGGQQFLRGTRDLARGKDSQFRCFNEAARGQEGCWPEDLAWIMKDHLSYIQDKYDWDVIQRSKSRMGRRRDRCFETQAGIESRSKRQSHRMLRIVMKPYASQRTMSALEEDWMLDAMIHQGTAILAMANKTRPRTLRLHIAFPTLVFSFVRPARVRVLYGYFEGTLKVQATKLQDFNVPNYIQMMESLLRWGSPTIYGDTRMAAPLPPISEPISEHDEAEGNHNDEPEQS